MIEQYKKLPLIAIVLLSSLNQACQSAAPFASEKSAMTLGKGHSQFVGRR